MKAQNWRFSHGVQAAVALTKLKPVWRDYSKFLRFVLNFMANVEHENVLKSCITSGLCSDSGIVLS